MLRIKMKDIHTIEADYEKMHIYLINDTGVILHVIKCISHFDLSNIYADLEKRFEESINGKNISICLSGGHESGVRNKSYKKGSSFMDFSSSDNL